MTYGFIDPDPAEGVFFCPRCMCDQLFETDPGKEKDLNKPLYCVVCMVRIDVAYRIEQIHPYPEVRIEMQTLTMAQREAGALKLMRMRVAPPVDGPLPLQLGSEDDLKRQLDQLSRGMR